MRTNYHTHTTRCLHATGSDEEFVLSAIKGGYQELGFSDHTPWKYHTDYVSDIRMTPEELPEYVESLRSLQKKYKDQISIKIGLECEYFPEYIPWLKWEADACFISCGNTWQQTVIIAFSPSQPVTFPVESYTGNGNKVYVCIVRECFSNWLFDAVSSGCHIFGTGIEA